MFFKDTKTDDDKLDYIEYRYSKLKKYFTKFTTGMLPTIKVRFHLLKRSANGALGICYKRKGYYEIAISRKSFTTKAELDELMIHEMAHLAIYRDRSLTANADHKTHAHCKCWKKLMLQVKRNKANPYR